MIDPLLFFTFQPYRILMFSLGVLASLFLMGAVIYLAYIRIKHAKTALQKYLKENFE